MGVGRQSSFLEAGLPGCPQAWDLRALWPLCFLAPHPPPYPRPEGTLLLPLPGKSRADLKAGQGQTKKRPHSAQLPLAGCSEQEKGNPLWFPGLCSLVPWLCLKVATPGGGGGGGEARHLFLTGSMQPGSWKEAPRLVLGAQSLRAPPFPRLQPEPKV